MTPEFIPNGTSTLPCSPATAASGGTATGASPAVPSFPPGTDPAAQIPLRDVWPLSAAPLTLAALPEAPSCAGLRTRLVAAEWSLGSLAVAAEQVARDLVAAAVTACGGLPGQPVVQLWLRGDGSRMLLAVRDDCPQPPATEAGEWPFAGIAVQRGWHEHESGKTCWAVLSWRDARPARRSLYP